MLSRFTALLSRSSRPRFFDPDWYLETYADVAASGMHPLRHYLRHGRNEGRLPCFMVSTWYERDLRWGLTAQGDTTLERLARGQVADETDADRIWATLACARAAARCEDWQSAADWVDTLHPKDDIIDGFSLSDPSLLAIEACVMTGALPRAKAHLKLALRQFGPIPDLLLAQVNVIAADMGFGSQWQEALTRLYKSARLTGVSVTSRSNAEDPFDRLVGHPPRLRRSANQPLVSVIMPARDAEATIATALRSLMAQSWQQMEIIVVDNGSCDTTADVVRRMMQKDDRIHLLDGSAESGTYTARNLGVEQASGDLITVLDADDWAHPERIERQARALLKAPSRVVATLSSWVRTTPDLKFTRWWGEDGLVHADISSLMIRAPARAQLGYWDRVHAAADTEYIGRVRAMFGADAVRAVLPDIPLSFGRVHGRSLTQNSDTQIESILFGARRDYDLASRRWHERMRTGHDLPLPLMPERRPFPVPTALALQPSDPPPDDHPAEWVTTSGYYDNSWYMQTYADLRATDLDGARQYEETGEAEGRSPGPQFSPSAYDMAYGPLSSSPLRHFLTEGRARNHAALPDFQGELPGPGDGRHILVFGHQAGHQIFGAERCLVDFLDSAIAAGVTPSVVLPQILNRDYLQALKKRSHQVYVRPYGWIFGSVPPHEETLAQLTRLIQQTGAHEVHQNTLVLDAPLHAARSVGVPTVVHVHELPASDRRLCMGLGKTATELRTHILGLADRLIANSPPVRDWLDVTPDRVTVVPSRIDRTLLNLPFQPGAVLRVGLIGSLVTKKGVRDVAEVARRSLKAGLKARFVLIGPATPDLDHLGLLPANIEHTGYMARPADAISQCDIVLSLSHVAESFGRTVLEAMAAGRPVICYDRGMPPELVGRDGRAGRVVPADAPDAVVAALRDLLSAPASLPDLSHNARLRAAHYLSDAQKAAQSVFATGQQP